MPLADWEGSVRELRVISPASRAEFEDAADAPPAKGATVLVPVIEPGDQWSVWSEGQKLLVKERTAGRLEPGSV